MVIGGDAIMTILKTLMKHNYHIIIMLALFLGCGQPEREWPSKTKAVLEDGTPVEICVYYEPLEGDGFVINVHRPDDPVGQCWGTVIYPKPIKDKNEI